MRLALVLEHFKLKRRIGRVIEVFLHIVAVHVGQALLQARCTLVQHAQFLVTKCHIVQCEQENKLVMLVFTRLNLLKHRLSFLQ